MSEGIDIIFGSQTGTSEGFAQRLAQDAQTKGLSARVFSADSYPSSLGAAKRIAVITSTFGSGAPPDNFSSFFDTVQESTARLEGLNYAVFGCGSTAYGDDFCVVAKRLDSKLADLGAKRISPLFTGDDTGDLEADFNTWEKQLLAHL
eukprot:m51a1_g14168 hypothetical protein (148) ;mRNA; f:13973-14667